MANLVILSPENISASRYGRGIRHVELAAALNRLGASCAVTVSPDDPAVAAAETIIYSGDVTPPYLPDKLVICDTDIHKYFESRENNSTGGDGQYQDERYFNLTIHHRYLLSGFLRRIRNADALLVGNDRQRDLVAGMILGHEPAMDLADRIAVIPNGIPAGPGARPDEPLRRQTRVLKGIVPGIHEHDIVVLWWGCGGDWYDFKTIFMAMRQVSRIQPRIKLVIGSPRLPDNPGTAPAGISRWLDWARENNLLNRAIFVLDTWVDYADRGDYLAEADMGIYCQRRTLEARYSVRTRFHDYLWAELPMIISEGDEFEETVRRHQLGAVIREDDVNGWVETLAGLADSPDRLRCCRQNLAKLKPAYTWDHQAAILLRFINRVKQQRKQSRPSGRGRYLRYLITRARDNYRQYGLAVTFAKLRLHMRKLFP